MAKRAAKARVATEEKTAVVEPRSDVRCTRCTAGIESESEHFVQYCRSRVIEVIESSKYAPELGKTPTQEAKEAHACICRFCVSCSKDILTQYLRKRMNPDVLTVMIQDSSIERHILDTLAKTKVVRPAGHSGSVIFTLRYAVPGSIVIRYHDREAGAHASFIYHSARNDLGPASSANLREVDALADAKFPLDAHIENMNDRIHFREYMLFTGKTEAELRLLMGAAVKTSGKARSKLKIMVDAEDEDEDADEELDEFLEDDEDEETSN